MPERTRERSFDELAKGLAGGTVSRRKAIRLMGAALVGGALASVPGAAWAAKGGGGGKSACAKYCKTLFGGDTAAHEECVSQGAQGAGPCYSCTQGVGPGPGFTPNCTAPKTQFNANTCQCECPATTCEANETLNTTTCQCEAVGCIAGTTGCCPTLGGDCLAVEGGGTICATAGSCQTSCAHCPGGTLHCTPGRPGLCEGLFVCTTQVCPGT